MTTTKRTYLAAASLVAAFVGCSSESDIDTTVTGECAYEDAQTDQTGAPHEPARPDPQTMTIRIDVEGTGDLSGLDPQCSLDQAAGAFGGLFEGEASLAGDGAYLAGLASAEAVFETPMGCEIPDLQIAAVTDVKVRAEIQADARNCESYCQAKARADGESQCGTGAGSAQCRSEAEAAYESSCTVACEDTTHVIVAEASLSTSALAELNAQSFTGTALGDVQVDLRFDHIEDESGDEIDDAP